MIHNAWAKDGDRIISVGSINHSKRYNVWYISGPFFVNAIANTVCCGFNSYTVKFKSNKIKEIGYQVLDNK